MRVALRSPDGHVCGNGDLFERKPERILEDDDAGLLGRDLGEAAVELAPQFRPVSLSRRVRVGGGPSVLEQRLARPGPLTIPDIAARVDRQPVQPGRELRLAAKLLDLDAELRQGFLRRVPRIFRIAKQMARELLHPRCVPFAESLESSRVTAFRSCHKDRIPHPPKARKTFRTASPRGLTPAATWQLHLCALV